MIALLYMITLFFAAVSVYFLLIFPTQWVKIERIQHRIGIGRRIVQISDLHVERLRVSPERLRILVGKQQPDLIFLTGDYTQKLRYVPLVDTYLRELVKIGVPIYAVLGNHDYRLGDDVDTLLDVFHRLNIPVLRNESIKLSGFTLVGIDDFVSHKMRVKQAFEGVGEDDKIVVITHDPNVSLRIFRRYDYLMCGHFHGKQIRLPFLYYFKQKGPLAKKGIFEGLHRNRWGVFYISKGISQAQLNIRFMVRSEFTVHEL